MRAVSYLSALTALVTTTAVAQALQGTWQGSIPHPTEHFDRPYVFEITKDASNHWAAGVSIDKDWGAIWKADSVTVSGRNIKFIVSSIGSSYAGQLSNDGNSMRGVWLLNGQLVPLTMQRPTPPTLWRETPHKTTFVTVQKNVELEVLDWGGSGRPMVMLPGAGLTAHLFSQLAAKLTLHYHVYGITPPGFGASSVPPVPKPVSRVVAPNTYELKPLRADPYGADRIGDDVIEVLNTLHIDRAVLVGHSIAGEYLTSVASRYPQRVAGLIYLDALAEFAFSDGQRYDALFTNSHPMRVRLQPGKTLHLTPNDALLLGMHEYRHFPSVPALAIFALPHHIPGLSGRALIDFNASEQRAVDRMERIKPLLPTVRIVDLPNADHMVWESNEADVLREMNAFLAKLPQ
ncbi:MAG TPA: alpha/beta hydrolase [Steroidobacteraceae bacterium]|jgi:pimeloyl-ACP methyl ester carboxylesterase|nr:alpha/beta hydrolase [Steroidobacteraceae bacterium]